MRACCFAPAREGILAGQLPTSAIDVTLEADRLASRFGWRPTRRTRTAMWMDSTWAPTETRVLHELRDVGRRTSHWRKKVMSSGCDPRRAGNGTDGPCALSGHQCGVAYALRKVHDSRGRACNAAAPEPSLFPQISQSGNVLMTVWFRGERLRAGSKCVAVRIGQAGIAAIEQWLSIR
jgi:hypothetical protein